MATESIYTKEFEDYWKTHEAALLRVAPKVLRDERANNGKMNTAGDWLLFIIPIMAMVYRRGYQGLLLCHLSERGSQRTKRAPALIRTEFQSIRIFESYS